MTNLHTLLDSAFEPGGVGPRVLRVLIFLILAAIAVAAA